MSKNKSTKKDIVNSNITGLQDYYYNDSNKKQRLLVTENSELKDEYKRIREANAIQKELPDEEIIDVRGDVIYNDEYKPVQQKPKELPLNFNNIIFNQIIKKNWTSKESELESFLENTLNNINKDFFHLIENETENIAPVTKQIDNILMPYYQPQQYISSVEDKITDGVLKDLQTNKKQLFEKKSALDEEKMILNKQENIIKLNSSLSKTSPGGKLNLNPNNYHNNLNTSILGGGLTNLTIGSGGGGKDLNNLNSSSVLLENLTGKDLIEHNIRQSRLKQIKNAKENIENKIKNVEIQVKKIIEEEELNEFNKKEIIKTYIDNFEKDALKAQEDTKIRKKEYKQKLAIIEEKEQALKELPYIRREEEMKQIISHKENLVKQGQQYHNKRKAYFQKIHEKINNIIRESSNSPVYIESKYKYVLNEEKDKLLKNQKKEELEKKLHDLEMEKKEYLKPINREELNNFAKKMEENKTKIINDKEKKRMEKLEKLVSSNASLPKAETLSYKRIIIEKQEEKEKHEKEKLDKIYKQMKVQNFSKLINSKLPPKVDDEKKKEIEERVKKLNDKRPKRHAKKKSKGKYILLKNPHKTDKNSKEKSHDSIELRAKSEERHGSSIKKRAWEKKKPLEKKPDYLDEIRKKRLDEIVNTEGKK